jgi:hypothetical protein
MSWVITEQTVGVQPITDVSSVQQHPLGTIARARHATQGEGEFIYLKGVADTVVGLLVEYNRTDHRTTLSASATNKGVPVAVAMAATVADRYGWYQLSGNAVVKKTAVTVLPQVTVFMSATTGRIKVLASAGRQLLGAKTANLVTVTSTTSTVVVTIDRPTFQGQVAAA